MPSLLPIVDRNLTDEDRLLQPAEILAMFIVDTKALEEEGPLALVVIDEEYQDLAALMQG